MSPTGPFPISAATKNVWLKEASEFQRRLLADDQLSLAEYEEAKLAQLACLREAGLTVLEPVRLDGLYRYQLTVAVPEAARNDAEDAISRCKKEYAHVVEIFWGEVSLPLIQEVIEESRRLMGECYQEAGIEVTERPYASEDQRVRQRYLDCLWRVDAELDLGGVSYGADGDGRPQ